MGLKKYKMEELTTLEGAVTEFEELKIKEKELKERISILKGFIEKEVPDDTQISTPRGGKIIWKSRPNYQFSEEVEGKDKALKELKAFEIQEGIAINKPTKFIEYSNKKKNEK